MRGEAEQRGGGDDHQRRADGGAHRERERDGERRDDEEAAADAEEAGDEADGGARRRGRAAAAAAGRRRCAPTRPSGSGSLSSALRQVACAAASITSAKAASSSAPLTASAASVPSAMPGMAAAVNEPAWRQQTRPARAWPEPAGDRAGGDDQQRCGRGLGDGLVEDVDEHRHGEHGPAAAERADGQPDGEPERDGQQHAALGLHGLLGRPALALPQRHAALDDVDDLLAAVALEQARGDRRALAGAADDRDRRGRGRCPSGTSRMSW